MAGATGDPALTFLVGGTSYDRVANRVRLRSLVPYSSRQAPSLAWSVHGGAAGSLPDPFLGKSIELQADEGSGAYTLFKGTCEDLSPLGFGPDGWTRSYVAHGLRAVADRLVPVTSPLDGTDTITFNRTVDDRDFNPALAGFGVGDIIRYVLESPAIVSALVAIGVGGYTSVGGSGATATASVSGGHPTITVQSGGTDYTQGAPPSAVLVGGGGSYTSCTVTVNSSGVVTGITVSGSTGYTSAPSVWISTLPATTLRDLAADALAIIPPYPVTIQGDAVLQAIEGCLRQNCKNHYLHVGPNGIIRIFDLRTAESAPTTLVLNSTNSSDPIVDVGRISLARSTAGCYGRVVVRGGPDVVAQYFSLANGTLEKAYTHDGLTISQAEAAWNLTNFTDTTNNSPGTTGVATLTATISGSPGAVTSLTVTDTGSGYTPNAYYSLSFTGGSGSGAKARFLTSSSGSLLSWQVQAGGSGYTTAPNVTAPAPGDGGNADTGTITNCTTTTVTVQSGDTSRTWPADYWAWTSGNRSGVIYLTASSAVGVNQLYSARVISNTELTAAGTSVFTLDRTLPITTYDSYYLAGAAGGASEVYRRYQPTDDDVRGALMTYFPFPQAMKSPVGTAVMRTSYPTAMIVKTGVGQAPMGVTVDVIGGSFLLDKPAVVPFGTPSKLRQGGSNVDGIPDDIVIFGAVRVGNLRAIAPADSGSTPQYEGTGQALERTLWVSAPDWIDKGNQANMDKFASEVLDSVKDVVVEGVVPVIGYYADWLTTPNRALALDATYATPWDGIPLPAVECELAFRGEAGGYYTLDLRVSNRRGTVDAAIYERPIPRGGFLSDVGGVYAGPSPLYGYGPAYTTPGEVATDVALGAYGLAQDVATQFHATTPTPDQWLSDWAPAGAGMDLIAPAMPPAGGGQQDATLPLTPRLRSDDWSRVTLPNGEIAPQLWRVTHPNEAIPPNPNAEAARFARLDAEDARIRAMLARVRSGGSAEPTGD